MEQTYKEHTIKLSEDWRFTVEGPQFDAVDVARAVTFASLASAKEAIDARIEAHAKQKKAEISVAAHVLDEKGVAQTVRGIHASQGHLLGVEGGFVYPVHPVLREKLSRLAKLHDETDAINKEIHPYRVQTRRTYGRTRPDEYEALVQKFTEELAAKSEKARGL